MNQPANNKAPVSRLCKKVTRSMSTLLRAAKTPDETVELQPPSSSRVIATSKDSDIDAIVETLPKHGQRRDSIGASRASQKRAHSAPNRNFGYWYLEGHSKYKDQSHYRGRPLHETLHTDFRMSLLSSNAKHLNLKGFMNLACVILVVINFRMVVANFRKYGLLLEFPTVFKLMHNDWPLTRCCIKVHISIIFAWGIERFIAPLSTSPLTISVVFLQLVNLAIVLYYPYLTVVVLKTEPALSAVMLATSVVWALKIYSFHHVCYDYRRAVCNSEDLSEICKTRMEAKAASHYPGCIKLVELYRFIIMPTVCFQFYYPMNRRIKWVNALRHFGQFLFLLAVARYV